VLNSLNNHVFPDLGEKPISDITKQDVIKTFRKLESAGMHETRARVGQRVVAVFEYAEIEEHCIGNPAVGLNKIFTKPKPKHFSSLPISELAEFLHKVEADTKATPITKLAILFMIHVFVRSKSQRHAKWIDIDLDCAEPLWIVPSSDMKKGRELHVPLSPQVVKIFEELKQFSDQTGYVFPQAKDPKKVMSENTLQKFSIKIGYKGRSTIHGFRTVASTALHESMIWKYEVVEKQMSHLVGSETSRAYNKAEHLKERRKMLAWWSNYVDSLLV
jgi:integrase